MTRRLLRVGVLLWILTAAVACQPAQPTSTPEPSATIDATGTVHAAFGATTDARWTAAAQSATTTATSMPTATATPDSAIPEPISDPPYLQSGGAVPSHALARIGIGQIYEAKVYLDHQRVLLRTGSGIYAYRFPGFERIWRRYLDFPAWGIEMSGDGAYVSVDLGANGSPLLFNGETGERIAEFHEGWFGASFSPNGRMAAVEQTTWSAAIPY